MKLDRPEHRAPGWVHFLAISIVCFVSSFHYRYSLPAFDEGLYYQEAQRMLHGEVIYRDFFEFVTPGTFFFIKWIFAIFGEQFAAVRYVLFAMYVIESWLIFWLGSRLLRRPSLAYLPALFFVYYAKYDSWWSIQHHVLSHFAAVAGAYFLVRSIDEDRGRFAFMTGLAVGLTLCTTQHLGVLLLLATAPWICVLGPRLLQREPRRPRIAFLSGVASPVAMLGIYLVWNGAVRESYESCVEWVLTNYRSYEGTAPYYEEGRQLIVAAWHHLPGRAPLSNLVKFVMIGYVSVLAMLVGLLRLLRGLLWKRPRGEKLHHLLAYGAVWSVTAAMVVQVFPHANYYWIVSQSVSLAFIFIADLLSFGDQGFLPVIRVWFDRTASDDGLRVLNLHIGLRSARRSDRCATSENDCSSGPDANDLGRRGEPLRLRPGHLGRLLLQILMVVAVVCFYADIGVGLFSARERSLRDRGLRVYIDTPVGKFWTLETELGADLKRVCDYVKSATHPGQSILVLYHTPYLYSFLGRPNASRYAIFWPGYHSAEQIAQAVSVVSGHRAALVIKDQTVEVNLRRGDLRLLRYGAENLAAEPLLNAVQRSYSPVLQTASFTVLAPTVEENP